MKIDYLHVTLNDPTVHRILRIGGTEADCIVALYVEKKRLLERIMELEDICPKRIRLNDGSVMVYHCPNELIPITPA